MVPSGVGWVKPDSIHLGGITVMVSDLTDEVISWLGQ